MEPFLKFHRFASERKKNLWNIHQFDESLWPLRSELGFEAEWNDGCLREQSSATGKVNRIPSQSFCRTE